MTTPPLTNWNQNKRTFHRGALLLGNGQSRAVWKRFEYGSLREAASSNKINDPLTEKELAVFAEFKTDNFEQVLGGLLHAKRVARALNSNPEFLIEFDARHETIRRALIQAIHWVHLRRESLQDDALDRIAEEILRYDAVFTTNYDLIIYWALINWAEREGNQHKFRDFFFWTDLPTSVTHTFHLAAAEKSLNDGRGRTNLYHLHGALHLVKMRNGIEAKLTNDDDSLLDQFYELVANGNLPLLISGGDWNHKQSIRASRYLDFCLMFLERYKRPLVILGHSMSDVDRHIRDPIRRWGRRKIAIGVRDGTKAKIVERVSEYTRYFPSAELTFFDSTTHPLTAPDLQVPEEDDE